MTAASVSAYALVYALGLPDGLLAVITAIVVTQSSVGGSLKAAFDQFVGSLFGAVYATGLALTVSPEISCPARSPSFSAWRPLRSWPLSPPAFA